MTFSSPKVMMEWKRLNRWRLILYRDIRVTFHAGIVSYRKFCNLLIINSETCCCYQFNFSTLKSFLIKCSADCRKGGAKQHVPGIFGYLKNGTTGPTQERRYSKIRKFRYTGTIGNTETTFWWYGITGTRSLPSIKKGPNERPITALGHGPAQTNISVPFVPVNSAARTFSLDNVLCRKLP